jgi:transcriptional accessory protein Tex/SPT6
MINDVLYLRAVESRKDSVIKSIGEKITPDIRQSLKYARSLQEVEDIVSCINIMR